MARLELVAVDNLVFIEAWEAAGNRERPSFQGMPFDLMADDPATEIDEAHHFEPHYDLHVWLYRANPAGCSLRSTRTRRASITGDHRLTRTDPLRVRR